MKIEDKMLEGIEHYLVLYRGEEFTKGQTAQRILSAVKEHCVIPVEGELPDEGMGTYEATRGAQIMYQNMLRAGYRKVRKIEL